MLRFFEKTIRSLVPSKSVVPVAEADESHSIRLISSLPEDEIKGLITGLRLDGTFSFNTDYCGMGVRWERHKAAQSAAKMLYQMGVWIINAAEVDAGEKSQASSAPGSSTDVTLMSVSNVAENETRLFEQYHQLEQYSVRNGSVRGSNPLQLAFILKTALDALTAEEINFIYRKVSQNEQQMTIGTRPVTFPNGSTTVSDNIVAGLIVMYANKNPQLKIQTNNSSFLSPAFAFKGAASSDDVQALMTRSDNRQQFKVILAARYQQVMGVKGSSIKVEEIEEEEQQQPKHKFGAYRS